MVKKKSLMLLIGLIIVSLLVGCFGGQNKATNSKNEPGSDANDSNEPVVIRLAWPGDSGENPVAVEFYKRLEKGLEEHRGLKVEIDLVEVASRDALNLLLNSGDIPDLIYFQGGGDLPIAQQGLLEDLRPYIANSTYIKDIIAPHNEARLENYPYLLWIKPALPLVPVVRQDLFDQTTTGNLLLENPTIDNYLAFFRELVSIGGADNPKYALTSGGSIVEFDFIFDMAFGLDSTWLENENGELEYYRVTQNEKEKLAFYHQLYEAGLLDPQYVTKGWEEKERSFYSGETAVVGGRAGKVVDIYNSRTMEVHGDGAALVALPPAKGKKQGFGAVNVSKEDRGLAISAISEHKDVVFQILDYLASPEGQFLDRLGFEGTHYEVVDGRIELTDSYYADWYARYWEPMGYEPEMPLVRPLMSESAQATMDLSAEYYVIQDNSFTIPQDFVAIWDALQNIYRDFATEAIMGRVSIEDDFDAFVERWYAAGGQKLTEYARENVGK